MAILLYNFAKYKGYDVSGGTALDGFTDAGGVSAGALEAMRWAVDAGLVYGMGDGTLDPGGGTTRAQIAALIMRFCEKVMG